MHNAEIENLKKLKEIIHKFIKRSDEYNQMCQDEQHSSYEAEIDLIKLEQITHKFVNGLGDISEEEVLKHEKCIITLPVESEFVENLRKLEEKVSDFIKFVNAGQSENDGQYSALSLCYKGKSLTVLAKIAHELFHEQDNYEFVERAELPSTSLEVQDTQEVRIFSQVCQYLFRNS